MLRVALVGVAGALARYWIGTSIGVRSFPWATLAINVLGSFLLGVVLGAPGAGRCDNLSDPLRRHRLNPGPLASPVPQGKYLLRDTGASSPQPLSAVTERE